MYCFDKFHCSLLDGRMQEAYEIMLNGIKNRVLTINLGGKYSVEEVKKIYECILYDNPRIFYVDHEFIVASGVMSQFRPKYTHSNRAVKRLDRKIDKYLEQMKKAFEKRNDTTDLAKVRYVHDWCLEKFSCNHKIGQVSHTVIGPIFASKAVCDGISKFVKLALNHLGLNALVVVGASKNPTKCKDELLHAWNIVEINGYCFHLDVAYDLFLTEKINRYDYYCLADCDIQRDHTIDDIMPACNTGGDYFENADLVASSFKELADIIDRHIQKPGTAHFCVKLSGIAFTENIVDKLMTCALERYMTHHNVADVKVNVRYNYKQMVFEILLRPKKKIKQYLEIAL